VVPGYRAGVNAYPPPYPNAIMFDSGRVGAYRRTGRAPWWTVFVRPASQENHTSACADMRVPVTGRHMGTPSRTVR
jgi:hypothetical protein